MMIMAEKITMLRKRNGWSQEELAEKLGVSRQAVSKWESGVSLPDLDRMVKMSQLFCVSTDYLLKDEIEEVTLPEGDLAPESGGDYVVTLEEANTFLDLTRKLSTRMAVAVALCILSPICLIQLAGVASTWAAFRRALPLASAWLSCWSWWPSVWPSLSSTV